MSSRELLKRALYEIEQIDHINGFISDLSEDIREELKNTDLEPLTDTYIQTVPDKCDRIVWRGFYHHLPITKRNPLSKDDIISMWLDSDIKYCCDVLRLVRDVEKHHCIK